MAKLYSILTLPTVLFGYVGHTNDRGFKVIAIRRESWNGTIRWDFPINSWLFNKKPYRVNGDDFAITHLQKKSKFGFLITWPFCFHIWFTFKEQQMDDHDEWLPGTEKVAYARTPGYRKDIAYGMKWTWGYIGLHWD